MFSSSRTDLDMTQSLFILLNSASSTVLNGITISSETVAGQQAEGDVVFW